MRGGDKAWQHIKQGVPLRVEIGPRDLAAGTVSVSRRDKPPRERVSVPLDAIVEQASQLLEELQRGLFEKALAFREAHTVRLGSTEEVVAFFGGTAEPAPKGKGGSARSGFAHVHVADDPAVAAILDPLKVTVRCIPMDGDDEPGTCIVTGLFVNRRSVLARSY